MAAEAHPIQKPGGWTKPAILIVGAISMVWVAILLNLARERDQVEQAAYQDSGNLARGFGENINRMIEGTDQTLKLLRAAYARHPTDFDLARLFPPQQDPDSPTVQSAMTDLAGIMVAGNLPSAGRVDLSDREHIRVQLDTAQDDLFISKPVLGRVSKKWTIQFTRKVFGPDSRQAGVLVMSLDANYLSRFYKSLDIGDGTIILVGLKDGFVRSRAPNVINTIGTALDEATMRQLRAGPGFGHFTAYGVDDGIQRINSYWRLEKYDLAVIVGLSRTEAFANFNRDRRQHMFGGVVLSAVILLVGVMLVRQQRKLLRSQAMLTATLENMSQGILMVDETGDVPVMNERAAALLALPPALARPGVRFQDILQWQLSQQEFGPDDGPNAHVGALAARGGLGPQTYERVRPNGVALEVRTQALPNGSSVRTFTDITGRKAAEAALQATLDRFYTILASMRSGVLVVTADDRVEFVNTEFCVLFGLNQAPEDLRGTNSVEIMSHILAAHADPETTMARIRQIIAAEQPVLREQVILRDGHIILRDFIPIMVEGRKFGRLWQLIDVTAEKETEVQLRESESLKSAILQSSLDAVITIDADSVILEFNRAAEQIFGHAVADVIGRKIQDVLIPYDLRDAHIEGMRTYLRTGHGPVLNNRIELRALRADGTEFPAEVAITATQLEHRAVFTAYLRDISARKRDEQEISAARDAAEAASRAKTEFLSTMSHEIRTPMNGILGMAGLMLDGELPAVQRRFAETLRDAALDLLRIINDILDFSKLEAGHLEFETISFDVVQVVDSVVELMRVKSAEKGLELRGIIAPDVPQRLLGDPGRLRQVLINLVGNGLKFTDIGSVTIEVTVLGIDDRQTRLGFVVRDTGIGIPPELQDTLFRQFSQADSSISRRFGGTGLGLAISARLIALMGGTIRVESREGQGSAFHFDVLLETDRRRQPRAIHPIEAMPVAAPAPPATRRLRILVAEDNATNQLVVTSRLERMGHRADTVGSGQEAIDAVRTVPYDLVLMDVMMPEMDGLEATRSIRAMGGPQAEIPIVAVTANVFRQHELDCIAAGMDAFLGKPILNEELARIINRAIAGKLRSSRSTQDGDAEATEAAKAFKRLARDFDPATARELLETFATEATERIAAIRAAVDAEAWGGVARESAALRSAAETVGLDVLTEPTTDLAGAADRETAERALAHVSEICERIGGNIRDALSG